ncbi:GtrA family protein [Lacticaseibacillus sharpeae]|uniref:GtrA family protein n=1 Tax=Lacticaseibacillus sharpeae TaxID=1626 RepID=UPI0006D209BE|nr:GtrA family protein [Lacticaseibacillus sharpeae]
MKFKQIFVKYSMIFRYIIVGVATTAVNMVVYFVLHHLGMNYLIANTIAWFASVVFAFFTNKQIVFRSAYTTKQAFIRELVSFFTLRGVSLALDDGLMFLFISVMGLPSWVAKVITQVVVIISNYIFSKLIFVTKEEK